MKNSNRYCIYEIVCLENDKFYIGSCFNERDRWTAHRSRLNRNKHHSWKLQKDWNKFGEKSFVFNIIEWILNEKEILEIEQKWLDQTNAVEVGYNVCPTAGNTSGRKHSKNSIEKMIQKKLGKPLSQEHKEKLSIIAKQQFQTGERTAPWSGKKRSEETKQKISETKRKVSK